MAKLYGKQWTSVRLYLPGPSGESRLIQLGDRVGESEVVFIYSSGPDLVIQTKSPEGRFIDYMRIRDIPFILFDDGVESEESESDEFNESAEESSE